jgi:hypothetical protein
MSPDLQCRPFLAAATFTFVGPCEMGDIPDAASIDPAVFETILSSLIHAELDLSMTNPVLSSTFIYIPVVHFLIVRSEKGWRKAECPSQKVRSGCSRHYCQATRDACCALSREIQLAKRHEKNKIRSCICRARGQGSIHEGRHVCRRISWQ